MQKELRTQFIIFNFAFLILRKAGDENRTRVISLEDWGSTIKLLPRFNAKLKM